MTATPLPPLPRACIYSTNDNPAFDEPKGYGAHQMQSYATQARADLEAENQRLREALSEALNVMEGFDRFRRMMTDGPDASDKLLAEDYAEVAFLQAVEAIKAARAALKGSNHD